MRKLVLTRGKILAMPLHRTKGFWGRLINFLATMSYVRNRIHIEEQACLIYTIQSSIQKLIYAKKNFTLKKNKKKKKKHENSREIKA